MKNKIKYFTAIFSVLQLFISCDNKSVDKDDTKIVVTGKVENLKDTTIVFSYYEYDFLKDLARQEVKFDSDGSFKMKMEKTAALKGWFSFGKVPITEVFQLKTVKNKDTIMKTETYDFRMIYLYLQPGDSLHLTVDVNDIKNTYNFTGENAAQSIFVNQEEYRFNNYKSKFLRNYYNLVNRGPDEYKQIADELYQNKLAFLDDFSSSHKLSDDLIAFYKADYKATNVGSKINYPAMHASYTNKEETVLPEDYYNFLETVKLDGSISKHGTGYFYNLRTYLKKKYDFEKSSNKEIPEFYDWLETELSEKNRYEYMAYALPGDFSKKVYDHFDSNSPYPEMAKAVRIKYKDSEGMLEGSQVPNILFEDTNGGKVALNDLQNQYVYIDLWATWCGPCIKEIPYLQKVEKAYHGKNIRFVSVSVDSEKDKEKWKKFVKDKSLKGTQLYADSVAHNIIKKVFRVNTIPRFILLDTRGKVVSANAPKPSDSKLIDLFDKNNI
ncbi:hypothetical protein GCM10011416_05630 [Polaribacter pacificus]|uniref:Thioredoxin domain-containing protein n=1 Tax=Polaribacter pacificus TaxID=1775173 RepID=A0A917HW92_9FLAO|nr:TlpA disulfide reductase family protein [Polaribacter pacificus]GGG91798.1 hypothetical protein GCM10011416_05630 [Polaribacter pacificus]